jgi:hypothetical protein
MAAITIPNTKPHKGVWHHPKAAFAAAAVLAAVGPSTHPIQ